MAKTFESMLADARRNGTLSLNDVRGLVSHVKAEDAAAAAQVIETENMQGFSRGEKIAVFLAGLMANLIDDDSGSADGKGARSA